MPTLEAHEVLRVWEAGQAQHPVDQALTLLQAAEGGSRQTLAALPLGERDARLLALHERAFGPDLSCYAECPACGERVEFSAAVASLRVPPPSVAEHVLRAAGHEVHFRLLDSHDVAAAAACPAIEDAAALLARRCVVAARQGDVEVSADDLPAEVIDALGLRLAEVDPQAEILIDLTCPGCDQPWQAPLDLVPFLWTRLTARARRLMREVTRLARVLGWDEEALLRMSDARRQAYLALVDE